MALFAGGLLALMTEWNSLLAVFVGALAASWIVHGVGTMGSLALLASRSSVTATVSDVVPRAPLWSRLGGVPGALAVVLAAITVNGALGLAGTLALMLVGQMIFSAAIDHFGWFGLDRRRLGWRPTLGLLLVLSGAVTIVLAQP